MRTNTFGAVNFKVIDEAQGIVEAVVAVFDNVDRGSQRIKRGAFKATLKEWETKGRPIPFVYSHQWDNLDATVGQVIDAKEIPEGLYVKAQLDLSEEFASKVFKRMRKGTLAEFSFAYDVVKSSLTDEGEKANPRFITDLEQLDLFEVGPCLLGMNPDTRLISVNSGARHTKEEMALIQDLHDHAVRLGANCGNSESGDEGESGDEAPSGSKSTKAPSTFATRVAIELAELSDE